MNRVAVLGSTGSIGTSCLDVMRTHTQQMSVASLSANSRWETLAQQSADFSPEFAVLSDESLRDSISLDQFGDTEVLFGQDGIEKIAAHENVDTVLTAIVGAAGLRGTWAALEAGKRVALANKETLVVAGPLVMGLANERNAEVIPVDSEHSAIFQALQAGRSNEVKRVVLTASGGPFRGKSAADMANVTPEMALAHPTWQMGPKISVDSATMMNKALEIIEARWLFGLRADQIDVVVHPQSILHSFVEFVDGSVMAQMSPPDMKLPIQYALTWPDRISGVSPGMDWKQAMNLELTPPDLDAFPALGLGFEVAEKGGSSGVILNAANEVAVERFLNGDLRFVDIPRVCRKILETHDFDPSPSLSDLFRLDAWAREETRRWIS